MSFAQSRSEKKTDWLLVLVYGLLVLIGLASIYTSNYVPDQNITWQTMLDYPFGKQLAWVGISFVMILALQLFDRKFYIGISPFFYILTVISLILVLIVGSEISGSRSWFQFGSVSFQPSELAKVGTALAVAFFLSGFNTTITKLQDFLIVGALIVVPVFLILLQSDAGTAIVFTSFILVLYREGLSPLWLILYASVIGLFVLTLMFTEFDTKTLEVLKSGYGTLAVGLGLLSTVGASLYFGKKFLGTLIVLLTGVALYFLPYAIDNLDILLGLNCAIAILMIGLYVFFKKPAILVSAILSLSLMYVQAVSFISQNVLEPYQLKRILVSLNVITDSRGASYNLEQSKIAIGSGGWMGKGFLNGTQIRGGFVPEVDTDFIFCNIGEEFGFMGSLVTIGLFLALMIRIVAIAERQKSKFTRVYAYSVASIFFIHVFVNVAMAIGLAPVIGIPLPLISRGGSSFLGFSLLLFILIRLDSEKKNVVR